MAFWQKMSESNCYSMSLTWRVTVTLHSLYMIRNCQTLSPYPQRRPLSGLMSCLLQVCLAFAPDGACLPNAFSLFWCGMTGSNRRHPACKADALPTELIPHNTGVRQTRRHLWSYSQISHCIYPNGKGQLLPIVLLTQLTICKGLRFSFLEGKNATTSPLDIYRVAKKLFWWTQSGSNRLPPACKAGALPSEL